MEIKKITDMHDITNAFQSKKLLIIPTDTIYGLACSIFAEDSIKKIYCFKKRDLNKPLSIIVANMEQAESLIVLSETDRQLIQQVPSVTVIAPVQPILESKIGFYGTLGVRITNAQWLQSVILATGPIFATSVNLAGEKPSVSLQQLKKFPVDMLVYNGRILGKPSHIYNSVLKKMIR